MSLAAPLLLSLCIAGPGDPAPPNFLIPVPPVTWNGSPVDDGGWVDVVTCRVYQAGLPNQPHLLKEIPVKEVTGTLFTHEAVEFERQEEPCPTCDEVAEGFEEGEAGGDLTPCVEAVVVGEEPERLGCFADEPVVEVCYGGPNEVESFSFWKNEPGLGVSGGNQGIAEAFAGSGCAAWGDPFWTGTTPIGPNNGGDSCLTLEPPYRCRVLDSTDPDSGEEAIEAKCYRGPVYSYTLYEYSQRWTRQFASARISGLLGEPVYGYWPCQGCGAARCYVLGHSPSKTLSLLKLGDGEFGRMYSPPLLRIGDFDDCIGPPVLEGQDPLASL